MSWSANTRGKLPASEPAPGSLCWIRTGLCVALMLIAATGCYDSHPCPSEELCNYNDDDCDGHIDEAFVDEDGRYIDPENCGGCGIRCADVFPTASATECAMGDDGSFGCRITACPLGFHLAGDGACVPDVPILCLPCNSDDDCRIRDAEGICVETSTGPRCAPLCESAIDCPEGSDCVPGADGRLRCFPRGGDCTCNEMNDGLEIACLVDRGDGHQCAGAQTCGPVLDAGWVFSGCEPALAETCNETDDDCDGGTDEDFRDERGRYVDRLHCGGCAMPCVEPGPNMVATCAPRGAGVTCTVECAEGFVDVDRIQANGCECERWDGMGPPPEIGGDANCDGIPDDTDDFIFVTTTGSDTNPGTLVRPVRTIARAQVLARMQGKDVLVARGIYDGPFDVVGGVDLFGGYRPDFRDRDRELYPVLIERTDLPPGSPVLTCRNITAATQIDGFTIAGSDAGAPGEGSTAVYLDGCTAAVRLTSIDVLAGRGADGTRGDDSSDNLADWGLDSLEDLNGVNGTNARDAGESCTAPAGRGGVHMCRTVTVSGGNGGSGGCPALGCTQGRPCGNAGCTDFTVGGVCDLDAARRVASPNGAAQSGRGPGGGAAGDLTYNAPTNRTVCNFCDDNPTLPRDGGNGGDGARGADGSGGVGCGMLPDLDVTTGRIRGGDGTNGSVGTNGSGGGGATSGSGYAVIGGTEPGCDDRAGGGGGGGGSGGCGSPQGDGGTGAGSSAGIVVRLRAGTRTGPTLDTVRIVTASGGTGGDGGIGAAGGSGGVGGIGGSASFWCSRNGGRGGDGGRGGAGGGGGGGCGGGSHGIFVTGGPDAAYLAALATGATIEEAGVAGRGGRGGFSPASSGGDGLDGSAAPIFSE